MFSGKYKIVLASGSPRRRELLSALDLDYEVRLKEGVDESYPADLPPEEIAEYISRKKSAAYDVARGEILLTADTVVLLEDRVLGKPASLEEAKSMLAALSGKTHRVVTGCCLRTAKSETHFSVVSEVTFARLGPEEIDYYVDKYRPLDKAGAYGVQEWIGCVGVEGIKGSYFNVMGLPVQRVYRALEEMTAREV